MPTPAQQAAEELDRRALLDISHGDKALTIEELKPVIDIIESSYSQERAKITELREAIRRVMLELESGLIINNGDFERIRVALAALEENSDTPCLK
jgi:hypothetical protein